jgi:acyl-CoA synthetase (AMP-forming)/AMP-acid ligase II
MRRAVLRSAPGRGLADLGRVLAGTRLLGGVPSIVRAARVEGATLSAVVRAGARRFGDQLALHDASGTLSYAELDRLVDAAAAELEPGQRVAVMCTEPRWLLVAAAAIVRAGADAVLIGPGSGRLERAGILDREGITLTLTDGENPGMPHRAPPFAPPREVSQSAPSAASRGADRLTSRTSRRAATRGGRIVLLSSGTTGAPSPTARTAAHAGQALTLASLLAAIDLRPGHPVLILPPLHHGHGLIVAIACLLVGAPVVARGPDVVDLLARHDVAVLTAVPLQLRRLADALDGDPRPLPALRRVVSGSARLPAALSERLTTRLGPVLVDLFGSTETGTLTRADVADRGTVGRPVAGVRVRVVDTDGRTVDREVIGRVLARSPFARGERPTGDVGLVTRTGRLVLTGRDDGITVSGGENVSAAEVEDYLAAQPEVADVDVRVVDDPDFDRALVARVVLRTPVTADALRARVGRDLARAKAPRLIELVDEIPRTETGKPRSR